ncbi:unnamed protein product [Trifolium pratense]|uniref:Uncharacterized protein n=1 Tax=Trifolium pratense TaxID=57577 RepID=A0ACB0KIM9_TRIPR|nr:unnamed protein product [Trifolium pratense]
MKNFGRLGYIWPGTPVLGGSQNFVTHHLQALIWLSLLRLFTFLSMFATQHLLLSFLCG